MKFAMTNSAMKDETKLHSQGAFHVYNMPKLFINYAFTLSNMPPVTESPSVSKRI